MTPEAAYAELIRRTKEAAVLSSCGAVLGWDERTYMPHNGSAFRGDQMALLARLTHEMTTDPKVGECLAAVEGSPSGEGPRVAGGDQRPRDSPGLRPGRQAAARSSWRNWPA